MSPGRIWTYPVGGKYETDSIRPMLEGKKGAVSTAHPLATAAGQEILGSGGNAVDAAIAAQAVLCVVAPNSCGLGGDLLALVREPGGSVTAVNGTGKSPADPRFTTADDRGNAVTVPGLVGGWMALHERWGRLPLKTILARAHSLACDGVRLSPPMIAAVAKHGGRLRRGGAADWVIMHPRAAEEPVQQVRLAAQLARIAEGGAAAFYDGPIAEACARAVQRAGGYLTASDFSRHETVVTAPISTRGLGATLWVQPPVSQGVLAAMAVKNLDRLDILFDPARDHAAIEVTAAAFDYRARIREGAGLLDIPLHIDPDRAGKRMGPRSYLHTAGVATVDRDGLLVSSLVSVFDNFGSAIFVPEGGFTLNNRAQGFTTAANEAAPGKRPVHTLAPILFERNGDIYALSTPGADGQVQTLVQILLRIAAGIDVATAIHAPRWRAEDGKLLIEADHPACDDLAARGHDVIRRDAGDPVFGGIVCAGRAGGRPVAGSDWRREVCAGVA